MIVAEIISVDSGRNIDIGSTAAFASVAWADGTAAFFTTIWTCWLEQSFLWPGMLSNAHLLLVSLSIHLSVYSSWSQDWKLWSTGQIFETFLRHFPKMLVSDEEPATPSADGLAKLKQKHPPASLSADSLPPPEPNSQLVA